MGSVETGEKKKLTPGLCTALVIVAGVLWGTIGIFIRRFNAVGLGSLEISEIRCVFSAVIVTVITLCIDPALMKIRLKDIWCFLGTGVLSILFFNYCYFRTIQASSMAVAATLLYTAPVFVMLLSMPLFGEKITGRKIVSLELAVGGCVLVSGVLTGGGNLTWQGILLGIGAGVGYALYSIFGRYALLRGYHSMTITAYTFIFAAVGGAFLCDFSVIGNACGEMGFGLVGLSALYAVVTTVAPYLCYTVGLTGMDNSKASVMASIEPVTAAIIGFAVFDEVPDLPVVIGILMVLAAVVLLNLKIKIKKKFG